jgi:hypothetical protein
VADRSQCRECKSALPAGANYCLDCGAPVAMMILDPVGFEDPPLQAETDGVLRKRWQLLAAFVALMVVLWGLTRDADSPDDGPPNAETLDEATLAADPATSTTAVTTVDSADPTTTASEQLFVNDVAGPVLGAGVDGVVVLVADRIMRRIDLSTGAVERIDLEHNIFSWVGPESRIVNGELVALSILGTTMVITDLSDGSQDEPRAITDDSFDWLVAGRAGVDSVWLATYPGLDEGSAAIEVGVDGEVRRRVEIPQPFSIRWAKGDDLILESPDGSFRFDIAMGSIVRMPGAVVAFEPGLVITSSCDESLPCDVLVDRGSGAEVVDWPSASELFNSGATESPIDVSPDLSGALFHVYGQSGAEYTFIDLHTGSRVDLGDLEIDPYLGVVWVEGSRWIIGQLEGYHRGDLAIDTQTGAQVELRRRTSSGHWLVAFIPSN